MEKEDDRRASPRFHCSGDAEMRSLSSGVRAAGRIENLSLGGCLIRLEQRHGFREGESLEMTFSVRQLPLRVQASVRQVHSGDAVGVSFTLLSERGRRQLQLLIGELGEILHDQVEGLAQAHSSRAGSSSQFTSGSRSAEDRQKGSTRFGGGPVPINRKPV